MTQQLKSDKIITTLEQLQARIAERFPKSGLSLVCADLIETARLTAMRAYAAGNPNILLRSAILIVALVFLFGQMYALRQVDWQDLSAINTDALGWTQALEAGVNLIIFAAAAIWFLVTLEERLKPRQVFEHLHELRSYAHVIDMHQLTKDPSAILNKAPRTEHSPVREMTQYELARYLDYCAEMLAITGKLAALYGERTRDAEVISAANEIETLVTFLGRKIWQKIMIISSGVSPIRE